MHGLLEGMQPDFPDLILQPSVPCAPLHYYCYRFCYWKSTAISVVILPISLFQGAGLSRLHATASGTYLFRMNKTLLLLLLLLTLRSVGPTYLRLIKLLLCLLLHPEIKCKRGQKARTGRQQAPGGRGPGLVGGLEGQHCATVCWSQRVVLASSVTTGNELLLLPLPPR